MNWFLFLIMVGTIIYVSMILYERNRIHYFESEEAPKIETKQETKEATFSFDDSVFSLMNKTNKEILEILGEPIRKDKTAYGYTWWIYNDVDNYIQLGMLNERVETVFAAGEELQSEPIAIGASYEEVTKEFPIENKVTYDKGISHYAFLLNDEDIKTNPLVKLDDRIFVQLHIDTFTKKVSSFRIMTGDLLLLQRFYEMEYKGTLPQDIELTNKDWTSIQSGMEKQILDITNVYRERHGLQQVEYDESVSEVAYLHSKDMYDEQYFSHESNDGRGLRERLEMKNIYYVGAGENIAAQHSDAVAAMHGWLNSEGHRETMLNEQYNSLGIGIHRLYYTQNFIFKH